MRFYPSNDLYTQYKKAARNTWLSFRIHDHTMKTTVDLMNRAINCCEKWDSFLDVGAGSGRYSATLLSKFKRGFAVEIDPNDDLQKVAKENKNLKILLKPIQQVDLKTKVDFVLLADVFEHIPVTDVPAFIKGLANLQVFGGIIYLLTPNAVFCGPAHASGIYYKRHKFGHHKQYTEREVTNLFSKAGYEPIFVRYEDSRVRLVIKMLMIVVSFVDKKLLSRTLLQQITAPIAYLINIFFQLISIFSHVSETLHQHDDLNTRSLVLVLKKMK